MAAVPTAPDQQADRRVDGRCSPGQVECVAELLAGVAGPDLAQLFAWGAPVGHVAAGWQPGEDGHQGGRDVAGQVLGIAPRLEAAR